MLYESNDKADDSQVKWNENALALNQLLQNLLIFSCLFRCIWFHFAFSFEELCGCVFNYLNLLVKIC